MFSSRSFLCASSTGLMMTFFVVVSLVSLVSLVMLSLVLLANHSSYSLKYLSSNNTALSFMEFRNFNL